MQALTATPDTASVCPSREDEGYAGLAQVPDKRVPVDRCSSRPGYRPASPTTPRTAAYAPPGRRGPRRSPGPQIAEGFVTRHRDDRVRPSITATPNTASVCPSRSARTLPIARCQTRRVLSIDTQTAGCRRRHHHPSTTASALQDAALSELASAYLISTWADDSDRSIEWNAGGNDLAKLRLPLLEKRWAGRLETRGRHPRPWSVAFPRFCGHLLG